MATNSYPIHRAIGRPVTFKGFHGEYILIAGAALLADLLLFIGLYCCRINPWACIILAVAAAATSLYKLKKLSRKYGTRGIRKKLGGRKAPKYISYNTRRTFTQLKKA